MSNLFPEVLPGGKVVPARRCAWFMVPPGLTAQIAHALEFNFSPDIATPAHLCDSAYDNAVAQGLQQYPDAKSAQAAADSANTQASPALQSGPSFGLADIGRFFAKLGQRETWVRITEVGLGVGLIIIALGHLTGVGSKTPVGRALKVGKGVVHK